MKIVLNFSGVGLRTWDSKCLSRTKYAAYDNNDSTSKSSAY